MKYIYLIKKILKENIELKKKLEEKISKKI